MAKLSDTVVDEIVSPLVGKDAEESIRATS